MIVELAERMHGKLVFRRKFKELGESDWEGEGEGEGERVGLVPTLISTMSKQQIQTLQSGDTCRQCLFLPTLSTMSLHTICIKEVSILQYISQLSASRLLPPVYSRFIGRVGITDV